MVPTQRLLPRGISIISRRVRDDAVSVGLDLQDSRCVGWKDDVASRTCQWHTVNREAGEGPL